MSSRVPSALGPVEGVDVRSDTPNTANADLLQVQNRLWHLTTQLDQIQTQLQALRNDADQNNVQVSALVASLTNTQVLEPVHERLAELIASLDATQDQVVTLVKNAATVARQDQLQQLQQNLVGVARQDQLEQFMQEVAKQPQLERLIEVVAGQAQLDEMADSVKKLTRTQFKANTLAESKEQQVENALNILREVATRQVRLQEQPEGQPQEILGQNAQQVTAARREARAEFAAELLPALDSIELAFTNGLMVLERQQTRLATIVEQANTSSDPQPLAPAPNFWQRLLGGTPPSPVTTVVQAGPDPQAVQEIFSTVKDAFVAWLRGLELVRDRFAALLAKEEIQAIEALDQPFDPRLHVAVETETRSDVAPNTVVRVLRQGYRQQHRVLRYAEVVVARTPDK